MKLDIAYEGDSREILKQFEDNSFDSVVTDPPYELAFMGKKWDSTGIAYDVELWKECLRVLKPGGHLLSFGGTRTYHRMACAIEDAGFEIRDSIHWVYGSGCPKSRNLGEKLEAWEGWGTALKPSHEPIVMARKPLAEKTVVTNVLEWATGGINIDGCRVGAPPGRFPANLVLSHSPECKLRGVKKVKGNGNPNHIKGSIYEKGNIFSDRDGPKVCYTEKDGCETVEDWECIEGCPVKTMDNQSGSSSARFFKNCTPDIPPIIYQSKANRKERGGVKHPTIKPIALIAYLVRMVTPPGGVVLDPFIGSGTLALAARKEGMHWVGIDLDLTEAKKRLQ